ncbi:hypothetical protein SAMN05216324_10216 [Chryseobacterium limigenitum]|uniref:Uncharacterized protein n=1 Tax=Chryseobacterium limigenitum TaxID=1612149 RepID=A0A1K2IFH8_9FLAO|nr:hypothetical protein SAMN05216324_10216 [Chryseobacterium limigenitum]
MLIRSQEFKPLKEMNQWIKINSKIIHQILNVQWIELDKTHLLYFISL